MSFPNIRQKLGNFGCVPGKRNRTRVTHGSIRSKIIGTNTTTLDYQALLTDSAQDRYWARRFQPSALQREHL
jgi:hypothetical protein